MKEGFFKNIIFNNIINFRIYNGYKGFSECFFKNVNRKRLVFIDTVLVKYFTLPYNGAVSYISREALNLENFQKYLDIRQLCLLPIVLSPVVGQAVEFLKKQGFNEYVLAYIVGSGACFPGFVWSETLYKNMDFVEQKDAVIIALLSSLGLVCYFICCELSLFMDRFCGDFLCQPNNFTIVGVGMLSGYLFILVLYSIARVLSLRKNEVDFNNIAPLLKRTDIVIL